MHGNKCYLDLQHSMFFGGQYVLNDHGVYMTMVDMDPQARVQLMVRMCDKCELQPCVQWKQPACVPIYNNQADLSSVTCANGLFLSLSKPCDLTFYLNGKKCVWPLGRTFMEGQVFRNDDSGFQVHIPFDKDGSYTSWDQSDYHPLSRIETKTVTLESDGVIEGCIMALNLCTPESTLALRGRPI